MKRQLVSRRMAKRIYLFLIIILLAGMCSGCWDRVEIEQLSYVTAVGIDSADSDGVLVTFQTVIPRMLGKSQGGGGGGGGGGVPVKPYANYSVRARNVSDAVRMFELKNPRSAMFKTTTVIIMGEDEAHKNMLPPLDFFTRKPMMRRSVWVLVAKGRAEDILLKGEPDPGNFPAQTFRSMFQRRQEVSVILPVNFGQFLSKVERAGIDPFITAIKLVPEVSRAADGTQEEKQTFEISSMGVLKLGSLVSFLELSESRGVVWMEGRAAGGTVTVPVNAEKPWASLLVSSERSKITPIITEDGFIFNIEIKVEGYVSSVEKEDIDINKPEDMRLLEQEEEKAIYQEVMAAVNKSRELHSDFLGLGEKIYETNPKLWKEINQTWRDEWLPNVQAEITVSCKLTRTGLTAEPVKPIP